MSDRFRHFVFCQLCQNAFRSLVSCLTCLPVCLSTCLSHRLPVCLTSPCLSTCLSTCLSVYLSVFPVYLSVYRSVPRLPVCLPVCPTSTCLSTCVSTCLPPDEAWVGVYTLKDCYPVQETYTLNSSVSTSTRFFDLQLGISDPAVFTPPPTCQSASPHRLEEEEGC